MSTPNVEVHLQGLLQILKDMKLYQGVKLLHQNISSMDSCVLVYKVKKWEMGNIFNIKDCHLNNIKDGDNMN